MCPTYNYECLDCKHEFDIECLIDERNDEKECPKCKSKNSKKLISKAALNRQMEYVPIDTSQRR